MTPEERIAQLEQEVAQLKQHGAETRSVCLMMAGSARAFEIGVLALLSSTKQPEAVEKEVAERLRQLDSELVFGAGSEELLEAAQSASDVVMAALQVAHASAMASLPDVEESRPPEYEGTAATCEGAELLH